MFGPELFKFFAFISADSSTIKANISFFLFSIHGCKKSTNFSKAILPFKKIDQIGNLAAFDYINLDYCFGIVPKKLRADTTFNPMPSFIDGKLGRYNLFFSELCYGINRMLVHVFDHSRYNESDDDVIDNDVIISLNFNSIEKVNFYNPLYRAIVPKSINNLKGAQISSNAILSIILRSTGEDSAEMLKTPKLISDLCNICSILDSKIGKTIPFRNEISGNISSISVASFGIRKDILDNKGKILYTGTNQLMTYIKSLLNGFCSRLKLPLSEITLNSVTELLIVEILIFTNFFRGTINIHILNMLHFRDVLKTLIQKDIIPWYNLDMLVEKLVPHMSDLLKKSLIERFIQYEYVIKNPKYKLALYIFLDILCNRDLEKFIRMFLFKYLSHFDKNLDIDWFMETNLTDGEKIEKKRKHPLFSDSEQTDVSALISVDMIVDRLLELGLVFEVTKKISAFWLIRIALVANIFSKYELTQQLKKELLDREVLGIKFFYMPKPEDKQYIIKNFLCCRIELNNVGVFIVDEFVQDREKITVEITNVTRKSVNIQYRPTDYARLKECIKKYPGDYHQMIKLDLRFGFVGEFEENPKKMYYRIGCLENCNQKMKNEISAVTPLFDCESIILYDICAIMSTKNGTIFSTELIMKLINFVLKHKIMGIERVYLPHSRETVFAKYHHPVKNRDLLEHLAIAWPDDYRELKVENSQDIVVTTHDIDKISQGSGDAICLTESDDFKGTNKISKENDDDAICLTENDDVICLTESDVFKGTNKISKENDDVICLTENDEKCIMSGEIIKINGDKITDYNDNEIEKVRGNETQEEWARRIMDYYYANSEPVHFNLEQDIVDKCTKGAVIHEAVETSLSSHMKGVQLQEDSSLVLSELMYENNVELDVNDADIIEEHLLSFEMSEVYSKYRLEDPELLENRIRMINYDDMPPFEININKKIFFGIKKIILKKKKLNIQFGRLRTSLFFKEIRPEIAKWHRFKINCIRRKIIVVSRDAQTGLFHFYLNMSLENRPEIAELNNKG
ncbi:hypothetical protein M153_7080004473 [Pseudoloma neurophilia]|uniref:Uncharacterized protein n=1 Tax=Pseudoloma neurophilia TaxID=146866 RepID=A0A0R0LW94_9MICR|nr:hypothetical protein M153_7080004473 [Pseudoloma neurophilia]